MDSDEGTSRRPQQRFVRGIIRYLKRLERRVEEGAGEECKALLDTAAEVDPAFGDLRNDSADDDAVVLRSLLEAVKARPLDLADDFEVINGVPTFTWKDDFRWTTFYVIALSSDKTRMAFVEDECKICVCNLLDNFRLVAESDSIFERVNYVAFLRGQNNVIVVVHDNSSVSFLSVPMVNPEGEGCSTMKLSPKELDVMKEEEILPDYGIPDKVLFTIACDASESWVFASDPAMLNEVNLFSVSTKECSKVKILTEEKPRPRATFISIPQRALVRVVEKETNDTSKKTWIWKGIDFSEEVIQKKPIEIEGEGMELSDCGQYFLVWNGQKVINGALGLYNIKTLTEDSPQPLRSRSLPTDILDAKAKLLDRNSIEFSDVDLTFDENIPIVAFLVAHQNKVTLSFWDPYTDEILKHMDFQKNSMVWAPDTKLEFRLSPNMKWIVLGGWSKGRFALFSLESTQLVWDGAILDEELARQPYSAFEFDASGTKLIVNCSKTLYAFAPPCLIRDYKIEMCGAKYELSANNDSLLSSLTWEHGRLLSKELLKRAILAQLGSRAQKCANSFDAALSKTSETVAMLLWKKSPPLILVGTLDALSSKPMREYITDDFASDKCPYHNDVRPTDASECLAQLQLLRRNPSAALLLYPDPEGNEDHVVIFALNEGLSAAFKESSSAWTRPVAFSNELCFRIRQNNDGHRVACEMPSGVMIIDLNSRQSVQFVKYEAKIPRLLHGYTPECVVGSANGTGNGDAVVNIDPDITKTMDVTVHLTDRKVEEPTRVGCFCVASGGYSLAAYLEFKKSNMTPTALCIENLTGAASEEKQVKRICRKEWNPHTRRMMDALSKDNLRCCALQFDEGSGHLWFIGITNEESKSSIAFVPFGPHSMDDCVPNLYMKDYPERKLTMTELKRCYLFINTHALCTIRLLHIFGDNFLTMTFNNESNCDMLIKAKCKYLGLKISVIADKEESVLSRKWKQIFPQSQCHEHLTSALEGNDYDWVKQCLDIAIKERHKEANASLIKQCFPDLWKKFPSLVVSILEDDQLKTEVCDVEIDATVFKSDDYLQARMGTCDSIEDWKDASERGTTLDYWKKTNKHQGITTTHNDKEATTKALLEVFYLDDTCKTGLKSIIRFLLMHNAPSYIFKSSLLKWVITFKWETIWRRHSIVNCVIYLFYVGTFSTYTICVGCYGESLENAGLTWVYLFILLCVTGFIALYMAYKEAVQLITCCRDGKDLFGSHLYGFQSYFSSLWNVLEVMSYIMLFVVFCLHNVCLYNTSSTLPFLYTCSALELLMMWMKIWYYAQPFKKTGALVLLVENVIRDCVPFILLTLAVLIGFGLAMFAVLQSIMHKMDFEEDSETKVAIDQGFGNPVKSILTLFYAMVGMFDPTFFLDCGLWSILVTSIFVAYLSMQMILMLNMLISLMGDTFDRVKNTEEEQLLLGRARLIDACEAQLTRKQTEDIESKVRKWLYILSPSDKLVSEDARLWQGRVSTIANKIEKSNRNSQRVVISEVKEEIKSNLASLRKEMEALKSNVEKDTQSLKEMMKQRFVGTIREKNT